MFSLDVRFAVEIPVRFCERIRAKPPAPTLPTESRHYERAQEVNQRLPLRLVVSARATEPLTQHGQAVRDRRDRRLAREIYCVWRCLDFPGLLVSAPQQPESTLRSLF